MQLPMEQISGETTEEEQLLIYALLGKYIPRVDKEFDIQLSESPLPNPENLCIKKDFLDRLTKEAREIYTVLSNSPTLVEIMSRGGKFNRKKFLGFMRENYNWKISAYRARKAFEEIQRALEGMK